MSLKVKFAFWFAVFVVLILLITFAGIYFQSDAFRKEEFYGRLRQKALTTQRLFVEIQEIDSVQLRIIDRNNLTALPEERILIFDSSDRMIYSSVDADSILIDYDFIRDVRQYHELRRTDPQTAHEWLGLLVDHGTAPYVVIGAAYDRYGLTKMQNLRNVLVGTGLSGVVLAVLLAYLYVRNIVGRPLSRLREKIAAIPGDDLKARLEVTDDQDELSVLAHNFNALLERLERAFDAQRGFVQFASHELRTPLANMLSETENALTKPRSPEEYQQTLQSLREEQSRLIEMSNALLLLSHYEQAELGRRTPKVRIDEVLYNTIDEVRALAPNARILLDFASLPKDQHDLEVQGNESLLRTAFRNLIENARRYAHDQTVHIHLLPATGRLEIRFENWGSTLSDAETRLLFTPFFRGSNAFGKRGFGLGLTIAQRILRLHKAGLEYQTPEPGLNRFIVYF